LTTVESAEAWPLTFTLGNLPKAMQTKEIAREVVAYFPNIDTGDVRDDLSPFCKCLLFHRCWKVLCQDSCFEGLVSIPTAAGKEEQFFVVLGPYVGDLQEMYMITRQFGCNFGRIHRGCNNCPVPGVCIPISIYHITGWKLSSDDIYERTTTDDDDKVIQEAIDAILEGSTSLSTIRKKLQKHSLHPVPVTHVITSINCLEWFCFS
jgi:hypothetical protein